MRPGQQKVSFLSSAKTLHRTVVVVLCNVCWQVDRSNSQSASSQPVSFHQVSTPESLWSSSVDNSIGQNLQANHTFATSVTYCNPDVAVSSVIGGSALQVSASLVIPHFLVLIFLCFWSEHITILFCMFELGVFS